MDTGFSGKIFSYGNTSWGVLVMVDTESHQSEFEFPHPDAGPESHSATESDWTQIKRTDGHFDTKGNY